MYVVIIPDYSGFSVSAWQLYIPVKRHLKTFLIQHPYQ